MFLFSINYIQDKIFQCILGRSNSESGRIDDEKEKDR